MRSQSTRHHREVSELQDTAAQRGGVRPIAEVITELWTQYRSLLPNDETVAALCRAADIPHPSIR